MKNSEIKKNTEKRIDEILKNIGDSAKDKIMSALNSGAIAEDSDFLKDNHLLAMTLLEDQFTHYTLKSDSYRKEANNIKRFI